MASKLKNFKALYNGSKNLEKCSQLNHVIQKENSFCWQDVKTSNKSHQNHFDKSKLFKYGAIISIFSAVSLFLYNCKDKLKIPNNLLPAVHALTKSESSLRKRFNFISEVVEKSADAVVLLENTVFFKVQGMNVPGVTGGSGFIVKGDGLILTNAHVVEGSENNSINVKLKDGRIFQGEIESIDFAVDLAAVRIKAKDLPVMTLGSSGDLKAGEWVIAMGSPLFLKDSVSVGIVSSISRKGAEIGQGQMDYIQTDAAIALGNSGGPLVNLNGEAVGVNTLGVASGISFAIPIDYAKEFLRKNEEKKDGDEKVTVRWPNYIGVFMQTITPEILYQMRSSTPYGEQIFPESLLYAVLINSVSPGSPAFKSGLSHGDVILEVDGERLIGTSSFLKFLESSKFLNLKVIRGNAVLTIIMIPE